jgi:hypothetical protein
MKIKADFVTNSSSSCFVVFVPNNYVPDDKIIKACVEENMDWWDDEEESNETLTADDYVKMMRDEVKECLEDLKSGNDIYKDNYGDGVDYKVYSVVDSLVSGEGFGLTSVETSGDGLDQIVGVPEDKVIKILGNHLDLREFCRISKEES